MEPTTFALISAAFFAAGCVRGVSGMGLPTTTSGSNFALHEEGAFRHAFIWQSSPGLTAGVGTGGDVSAPCNDRSDRRSILGQNERRSRRKTLPRERIPIIMDVCLDGVIKCCWIVPFGFGATEPLPPLTRGARKHQMHRSDINVRKRII